MTTLETDVLIVGAGPAGAGAATMLSTYGIPNIMVNKYSSVATSPRAHITNQRAMEVLRDLGVEAEVKAWAMPQETIGTTVWATSVAGQELGRLRTWYTEPYWKAEHDLGSPTAICDIPQDRLEPILLAAAGLRGTTSMLNTEFLTFVQDDEGVTSTLRDRVTGHEFTVRSKYVIGADGARSTIVEQLNLPMEGEMGEGGNLNVVFWADLTHLVAHRPADMFWLIQPGTGHAGMGLGVLRMIQPYKRWMATWGYDPAEGTPELTDELGLNIAHQIIGDDTIDVKIESVTLWSVNHMNVTNNMVGRVFVVGDAAHRHTPMHGLGSNTSIQDSFNLAWKLAAVLKGQAGPALLETFRDERVPEAHHLVDRVYRTLGVVPPMFMALGLPPTADKATLAAAMEALQQPTKEGAAMRAQVDEAIQGTSPIFGGYGMEMNQFYHSPAVVTDGKPEPQPKKDPEFWYCKSTYPGRHIIHAWLTKNQRPVALLDLVGHGHFTLLTGVSGGDAWRQAAAQVAGQLGVDIPVVTIGRGGDYEDTWGTYARDCEVAEDGALLVRPDQIIGWRADDSTRATPRLVESMRHILAR
ncbi:MAG: FAD-dependent monooxygenase [Propionibacteriaceae bacterium]|nr:FAD-dependent monooxygenase [Propionibacteriaceae bacterium]